MSGRVVVLGASGFLGGHVCTAFAEAGYHVRGVSRSWRADVESVTLDLSTVSSAELRRLLADADVVVNAAAVVWRTTEESMRALHVDFVERLAGALDGPRLVQLGSAYEYGPAEFGAATKEDDPRPPASGYGRTKRLGTEAVLRAAREEQLAAVVLRVATMAGPGAHDDSLPGMVARRLANGEAELRLAPLTSWRDYVDVRDVADAVLAAGTAPDVNGQVVNIGGGAAVQVRDLVHRMVTLSGVPARIVEQPDRTAREPMPWQLLDLSRARELLGWRPSRQLDDSLADLLAAVRQPQLGGTAS